MKELFTGYLNVSLAGSIIVCMILLLRFVFKKRTSKTLFCLLWLIAILRLLLPFQIEASWSLRPDTPIVTGQDTSILADAMPIPMEEVPSFVPQQPMDNADMVVIDYVKIASVVWVIGVCILGIYALSSYWRLKYRLRESVSIETGIYQHEKLRTAFLIGYFRPQIYLPTGMAEEDAEFVIMHECVHCRRGDNWLKLMGYICLCVHWFNPLVWLAFHLLGIDIEDACDEQVIRNMDVEKRKTYSAALLSCGKRSDPAGVYSVAFGETSIRQRILNILNYRKPSILISIVLVLSMAFLSIFFLVDPIEKHPTHYNQMMDLLGKSKEKVCAELELDEYQLEEISTGLFTTPITVEYEGVTMHLQLLFARHNNLLSSFAYYAVYEDNEQMTQDAALLAKQMWKAHGKGYQWEEYDEPERLRDITEEAIFEKIADGYDSLIQDQWDLTDSASKSAKTWLNQIEVSSAWQEAYGQKAKLYEVSPHFYLTYRVVIDRNNDTSVIALEYDTGWQPGHYSSVIKSDYN